MRALLAVVVAMGVLIVVGVATLAVTIVHRLSASSVQASLVLDEPPGTRFQSVASAGDRLVILLTGGGPDRIVLVDPRTGRATSHIGLPP